MYEAIRNGVQHGLQGQIQVQSEAARRQENEQVDSQEEPDPDRILVHAEQNGSKTK